jgi:hypothetical protein
VIPQAFALLAEHEINTGSHIIVQGLYSRSAGGRHFAVRVQTGIRLCDLTEGEVPHDKYYICDGLVSGGVFQEQTQEDWIRASKLWLVHSQGNQ